MVINMLYQLPFIIRNGYKFGKQSKLSCGNNQRLKASAGWNRLGSGAGETLGERGAVHPRAGCDRPARAGALRPVSAAARHSGEELETDAELSWNRSAELQQLGLNEDGGRGGLCPPPAQPWCPPDRRGGSGGSVVARVGIGFARRARSLPRGASPASGVSGVHANFGCRNPNVSAHPASSAVAGSGVGGRVRPGSACSQGTRGLAISWAPVHDMMERDVLPWTCRPYIVSLGQGVLLGPFQTGVAAFGQEPGELCSHSSCAVRVRVFWIEPTGDEIQA